MGLSVAVAVELGASFGDGFLPCPVVAGKSWCGEHQDPRSHCCTLLSSQEVSPEQLPWSYRDKTHFGRLGPELVGELVAGCRRKPLALVCGSPAFTEDMARCLRSAGLTQDSFFLF